jgi:prevent-host-death family protein
MPRAPGRTLGVRVGTLASFAWVMADHLGDVDFMTINGYLMVMTEVRIADLKSRLSEHLRRVRRGASITVLDRDTPVARLVPYEDGSPLVIRRPLAGAPSLRDVALPPPLGIERDVVELLLEERQGER